MFQITLRVARISCGYTEEEVTRYCGISVDKLRDFEKDCREMPITVACKMAKLFKMSLDQIYIGPEAELIAK